MTQWMTAARLRRNEAMASEIRREHTRSLARTIISPAHQTRLRLLQAYLDKVSQLNFSDFLPTYFYKILTKISGLIFG